MKILNAIHLTLMLATAVCGQNTSAVLPHCMNPEFDEKIKNTIEFTVPLIDVEELKDIQSEVYIFDTRNRAEYEISHIEGAGYLGYEDFDITRLHKIPKDSKIVLYCSIGYRSEKIGEQLKQEGFLKVYNLYGSIFEWVNRGNRVVDKDGRPTYKVHTYNRLWGKWIDERLIEKIW